MQRPRKTPLFSRPRFFLRGGESYNAAFLHNCSQVGPAFRRRRVKSESVRLQIGPASYEHTSQMKLLPAASRTASYEAIYVSVIMGHTRRPDPP